MFNVCNWSWKGFEKTRRQFCNLKGRVKVMMMQNFIMEKHCHSLDESLILFYFLNEKSHLTPTQVLMVVSMRVWKHIKMSQFYPHVESIIKANWHCERKIHTLNCMSHARCQWISIIKISLIILCAKIPHYQHKLPPFPPYYHHTIFYAKILTKISIIQKYLSLYSFIMDDNKWFGNPLKVQYVITTQNFFMNFMNVFITYIILYC
jgi:hypothetical protein